MISILVAS